MHVYRLSEPIDDFDGLTPLNEWLDGDAERLAWALRAVLALAQAAPTVGWRGDMRHLPLIGHLPASPFVVAAAGAPASRAGPPIRGPAGVRAAGGHGL